MEEKLQKLQKLKKLERKNRKKKVGANGETLIVRYSNRKLYNKSISEYVKLKDIFDSFESGEKFQVQEFDTKTDITEDVVLQAIMKVKPSFFKDNIFRREAANG